MEDKITYSPPADPQLEFERLEDYIDYLKRNMDILKQCLEQTFTEEKFADWIQSLGHDTIFSQWKRHFYKSGRITADENLPGNALQFLERVCPDKRTVLSYMLIRYLEEQPEYWVKEHISFYEFNPSKDKVLQVDPESVSYHESMTIAQLLEARGRLKSCCQDIQHEIMNNTFLYKYSSYEVGRYRILTAMPDAYFVEDENGEMVPVGYLRLKTNQEKILEAGGRKMKVSAMEYLQNLNRQTAEWMKYMAAEVDRCKQKGLVPNFPVAVAGILLSIIGVALAGMIMSAGNFDNFSFISITITAFCVILLLLNMALSVWQVMRALGWKQLEKIQDQMERYKSLLQKFIQNLEASSTQILLDGGVMETGKHNLQTELCVLYTQWNSSRKQERAAYHWHYMLVVLLVVAVGLSSVSLMESANPFASRPQQTKPVNQWSSGSLVTDPSEESEEPTEEETTGDASYLRVTASSANVRTGAGTSFSVYRSYPRNTELEATGVTQEADGYLWHQVTIDDSLYWISDTTVEMVSGDDGESDSGMESGSETVSMY